MSTLSSSLRRRAPNPPGADPPARASRTRYVVTAVLASLAAWTIGCSDGQTPRVVDLRFEGQAPDSPLVMLLSLDFEDDNGDLGRGVLETFINGRGSGLGALSLAPLFLWNQVPLDAAAGTLEFVLELAVDEAPAGAADFQLGVRVIDALGNVSDPANVRLRLEAR